MAEDGTSPLTPDDIRGIVRYEVERARAETRLELLRVGRAAAVLYGASLLLYLGVVFLTLMAVYILGALIEPWIGAAIVGGALLGTAIVVFVKAAAYARRTLRVL